MSNRIWYLSLGVSSLSLGLLIYVFLRTNSIVSLTAGNFITIKELNIPYSLIPVSSFLKYYFSDYLWAFSLCSFFHSIHLPKIKSSVFIGVITFAAGFLWETLQYLHLVSGTGDIADIIMYLAAALSVVIINLKRGNQK